MTLLEPVARAGDTCWRREHADRCAFLIDGASYFSALKAALLGARRRVLILGWDFHGRTRLEPHRPGSDLPDEIGPLLEILVKRRPELRVHVLEWDYSMLYAVERGLGPWTDLGRSRRSRASRACAKCRSCGSPRSRARGARSTSRVSTSRRRAPPRLCA
ncbi:MAG TPA: hypothetical protein VMR50_05290, partial [Myxococcota bacterium]|nr:hypothetical protein [Myxococcota bacterium]